MHQKLNIIIPTLLALLIILFRLTPTGQTLDLKSLDPLYTTHTPHPDIAVLAIDNKSLQKLGRWPWSRSIHAQIINKLNEYNPAIVGLDVLFAESENENADQELADALKAANFKTVLASEAVYTKGNADPQNVIEPLGNFVQEKTQFGLVNTSLSIDSTSRKFPEPVLIETTQHLPFTFVMARELNAPLPKNTDLFVNFAGPAATYPTFSITDLLEDNIPQESLSGKIVLIGATASDLQDTVLIPYSNPVISGIEWQANVLDNILLSRAISPAPSYLPATLSILLVLLYFTLLKYLKPKQITIVIILSAFLLPVSSFVLWQNRTAVVYSLNVILAVLLITFHSLSQWYATEAEKRKLKQTFQNYFSPQILQTIIDNPSALKLGGERREVTVFFSDIRSFTTITETTNPHLLSEMLHEYFTEMTEEILATNGVVDKFIGDAIMAFWGAPLTQKDQADRAVSAAVKMIKKLKKLQKVWEEKGYPHIDIGISINTGVATVGNLGSKERFDYTVIGDVVNGAARLESLNKEYKTHIIISESTKSHLMKKYNLKSLGSVQVKGKSQPLEIYEVQIS